MNAEPAITTNMIDPPLSRRNKRRRTSNESTSSKKPDDTALAPPTETRNKKLKRSLKESTNWHRRLRVRVYPFQTRKP